MTQIIALLTHERVYIVADSRLSRTDKYGTHIVVDDEAAKLVNLNSVHFLAYAGSSMLGAPLRRTELWVAEAHYLHGQHSHWATAKYIQDSVLAAIPKGVERKQHFAIVGFARERNDLPLWPYCLAIGNMMDERARFVNNRPGAPLRGTLLWLSPNQAFGIHAGGQPLRRFRKRALSHDIEKLVARKVDPKIILNRLAEEIRTSSVIRKNRWVGPRVLAGVIPRATYDHIGSEGNHVGVLGKEPEPDDLFPSFAIYDRNGKYITGRTGLICAKCDPSGRHIIEITSTSHEGMKGSIEIKIVTMPDPNGSHPSFSILMGGAKVRRTLKLWSARWMYKPEPQGSYLLEKGVVSQTTYSLRL